MTHRTFRQYRSLAEHYVCANLKKNNKTNLPFSAGGLLSIHKWNNIQYAVNAAFLLAVYSDHILATKRRVNCDGVSVSPYEILSFSKSQVDYILGANPTGMSYLVGYGPKYPKQVHHRAASMPSYKDKSFIGCKEGYEKWFELEAPNPNVIVGALVGGPDVMDHYRDERRNYRQAEACTYNTAPLVGLFAKFYGVQQHTSNITAPSVSSS